MHRGSAVTRRDPGFDDPSRSGHDAEHWRLRLGPDRAPWQCHCEVTVPCTTHRQVDAAAAAPFKVPISWLSHSPSHGASGPAHEPPAATGKHQTVTVTLLGY